MADYRGGFMTQIIDHLYFFDGFWRIEIKGQITGKYKTQKEALRALQSQPCYERLAGAPPEEPERVF